MQVHTWNHTLRYISFSRFSKFAGLFKNNLIRITKTVSIQLPSWLISHFRIVYFDYMFVKKYKRIIHHDVACAVEQLKISKMVMWAFDCDIIIFDFLLDNLWILSSILIDWNQESISQMGYRLLIETLWKVFYIWFYLYNQFPTFLTTIAILILVSLLMEMECHVFTIAPDHVSRQLHKLGRHYTAYRLLAYNNI